MLVARTFALCAGIGFGAGWIMPMINLPYIGCFICNFLGLFAGRFLAKSIDYHQLQSKVGKIIVYGLLAGMCLTPLVFMPFLMVHALIASITAPGTPIFSVMTCMVSSLFSPVCFFVGVLRPTVWGERW
jgi:hypothetical protein